MARANCLRDDEIKFVGSHAKRKEALKTATANKNKHKVRWKLFKEGQKSYSVIQQLNAAKEEIKFLKEANRLGHLIPKRAITPKPTPPPEPPVVYHKVPKKVRRIVYVDKIVYNKKPIKQVEFKKIVAKAIAEKIKAMPLSKVMYHDNLYYIILEMYMKRLDMTGKHWHMLTILEAFEWCVTKELEDFGVDTVRMRYYKETLLEKQYITEAKVGVRIHYRITQHGRDLINGFRKFLKEKTAEIQTLPFFKLADGKTKP